MAVPGGRMGGDSSYSATMTMTRRGFLGAVGDSDQSEQQSEGKANRIPA
jgi:hypothetical protein